MNHYPDFPLFPSYTAIVVTKDRPEEMRRVIPSLSSQTFLPATIIVVDASVGNETETIVKGFTEPEGWIHVEHLRSKPNISAQKNEGLRRAETEFVAFFDDDVILPPDYCERILHRVALDESHRIAGIAGVMANPLRRSSIETILRKFLGIQTDAGRNRFRLSGFPDFGFLFEKETEVEFLATGAAFVRKTFADGVWFEEDLLTGSALNLNTGRGFGEDVLFTRQLSQRGALLIVPEAQFRHEPSPFNREQAYVSQTLYVFAMRVISRIARKGFIGRAARLWALAGQGFVCAAQTVVFRNSGYIKGYWKAMTTKIPQQEKNRFTIASLTNPPPLPLGEGRGEGPTSPKSTDP